MNSEKKQSPAENKNQTENVCYVIGAGECPCLDIKPKPGDYVIAADGGYDSALRFNIPVDMLIGDMDSIKTKRQHPNVFRYPEKKDDSDMMLAVKEGMKRGFKTFSLWGGLGGRIDHTFANIQTLIFISKRGGRGFLTDGKTTMTAITDDEIHFESFLSGKISVFASGIAEDVCLKGLSFELSNVVLSDDFPLGLSNEFIGRDSIVSVGHGTLVLMWEGKI